MSSGNSRHGWQPPRAARLALAWLLAASLWLGLAAEAAPPLRPAAPTLGAEERARLEGDPHVMRWREARMAVDGVFESSARNRPLALNLFADAELEARVRSARTLEGGSRFLSGTLAGGGRFTLFHSAGGILLDQTVDVLVVYTPNAESNEGGREEIEATIEAEIEKTNQAFVNSGLSHRRIKLAGMKKVDHMQSTEDMGYDLDYLFAKKADSFLDRPGGNPIDPEGLLVAQEREDEAAVTEELVQMRCAVARDSVVPRAQSVGPARPAASTAGTSTFHSAPKPPQLALQASTLESDLFHAHRSELPRPWQAIARRLEFCGFG